MNKWQQGDVQAEAVDILPNNAEKLKTLVLREGEQTGHMHQVTGDATLFRDPSNSDIMFLDVGPGGAIVTHQTHGPIELSQGNWRVTPTYKYEDPVRRQQVRHTVFD